MDSAKPTKQLLVANAATYVAFIFVNGATQSGLFGDDNGTISARFPTPLTPAAWAFSIWGVIFLLQGFGVVYQWLPHGYDSDGWKARMVNTIGFSWVAGWWFEMAWQLAFQLQSPIGMWISLALILAALVSFGQALLRLYGLKHQHGSLPSVTLFVAFWLPTSINTAWLSVASSVAALVVPSSYHVHSGTAIVAVFLAVVVTAVGSVAVLREKDVAYGLVLLWSFAAVYGAQDEVMVRVAALVAIAVLFCVMLTSVMQRNSHSQQGVQMNEDVRQVLMPPGASPRAE
mmetsp:Transcript_5876/g.16770  ORF Transcript_5876/g.16770 Transcript_5876/m.16770 type:complete len:287 (-) Transcript_5876:593-1453(-)|eukprot:CAMPEP_0206134816 /NCGR_PEP_ID=MMETSP1473-20131121/222_1 /ASSEMBLY_ACC=CAM_ASM_001109 /TAXON_ID=1461547 /ORGANISM="Stichococcus sp, Strain RCC1054" /LENGTH=286 /DNA_ID=CAMNT_0053526439 /DNA_START=301 /DNA_END=1161 /DNA_ORIENTATION=+